MRDIFKEAKESAPSIIFIDEIDAIAPKREAAWRRREKSCGLQNFGVNGWDVGSRKCYRIGRYE